MKETKSTLPEQIITVKQFRMEVFKVKGSEFIAQVYPIIQASDASEILESVRKKYYDSTHNCFAYKYLNETQKYSDDGEPSGTAGIRILNAIEHFNLTNVLVVVTRYFGGTKLGVGPLGKAYYSAAYNVLGKSEKSIKYLMETLMVHTDFDNISHLYRIATNYKAKVNNSEFENNAVYEVIIKTDSVSSFTKEIIEATKGNIQVVRSEKAFYS